MEENKLVKYELGQLQKVSNQIAMIDKLLPVNFDYLKWWGELEEIWKDIFKTKILMEMAMLDIMRLGKKTKLTQQEERLLSLKKELGENDEQLRLEVLRYLSKTTKTTIGRSYNFKLTNLNPLKVFPDIEEIQFNRADIENISALESLNKLKLLDFSHAIVRKEQIEKLSKVHPNCQIILEPLAEDTST